MGKRSFVQKTRRTIVGAAKSGAARVQQIDVRAATAAATAAAEAAVESVMKSFMAVQGRARRTKRKMARRTSARRTSVRRTSARKTSRTRRRSYAR